MKVMEKMQYVVMKTDDIRTNLATEQYLMNSDKIKPPFMLFYIEKPFIIVGRNQNTTKNIVKNMELLLHAVYQVVELCTKI